jgi:hypothetical protein
MESIYEKSHTNHSERYQNHHSQGRCGITVMPISCSIKDREWDITIHNAHNNKDIEQKKVN